MDLIMYGILLLLAYPCKREIQNFWYYLKTTKQIKEKSFLRDVAGLTSLDIWTAIIVFPIFIWLPNEMIRKTAEEITIAEFIAFSLFEEIVFRILPWATLRVIVKIWRNNKEEINRLDYAVGLFTSAGFGLAHAFNFANPLAAIPFCIPQIMGGLILWYLQKRHFVGASAIYHVGWNLIFKLL